MKRKSLADRAKNVQAADKPRKAEKVYRPPGTTARSLGVFAFWTAFAFILLAFLANMLMGAKAQTEQKVELPPENPAASQEGVDFAKAFADNYFTWTPTAEGWEEQQTRMEPMLGKGVPENAGIVRSKQEWKSEAGDNRLLDIEEVSQNQALVTLEVEQTLTTDVTNETTGEDERKTETARHYFTVPVAFDGSYAIYDLPSFTAVPDQHTVSSEELRGDAVDAKTEENVGNFLATFFQSYASDSPDKLSYFLEGFESVQGLQGTVEFVEIKKAIVVKGDTGTLDVQATVVMQEPKTDSGFETAYRLTVKEKDGRYVVTKLNQGGH